MRLINILCILVISFVAYSSLSLAQQGNLDNALLFQVIQDQFIFDKTNIKSAMIIERNGNYIGLEIELKPAAIPEMNRFTKVGIGKQMSIVLDKKIVASAVIQTPLGGKILITGITKIEALGFLASLKKS